MAFFVRVLRELKDRIWKDRIFDQSAQLAYYFLLSLFPFLLLVFTLLGYLPIHSDELLGYIRPYAPAETYQLIKSNLQTILDEKHGHALSISFISTIYLASLSFHSMVRILDHAYRVHGHRTIWKELLLGFFLMFGLLFAIVISLILPIFGQVIGNQFVFLFGIGSYFLDWWNILRWLFSSVVLFFFFLCLYIFAPGTKVTFFQALPGSLFATIGWQLSSLAFSQYVLLADYSQLYGNLGGIIILVGWFYLSAMILILGGQLNAIICKLKGSKE